jgi:predicted  nucleic acid-binding Zn-ribbon protein
MTVKHEDACARWRREAEEWRKLILEHKQRAVALGQEIEDLEATDPPDTAKIKRLKEELEDIENQIKGENQNLRDTELDIIENCHPH